MGTAYGLSNCVGWFRAGIACYSDAGTTPAASGAGVYQWNDQSGAGNHLTQTAAAQRPVLNTYTASLTSAGAASIAPYGYTTSIDQTSYPPSLLFDGASSLMQLPVSATFSAAGCTGIVCSRGPYFAPLCIGSAVNYFIGYGWFGGTPQRMRMMTSTSTPFPVITYLPAISPVVHGFRCSATLNETRLYIGTNQTSTITGNLANFSMTGGAVGAIPPLSDPTNGHLCFRGEIYEAAFFNTPLDDDQVATLVRQMQTSNGLPSNANSSQLIFVGDSLTAGGPGIRPLSHCCAWQVARHYGGAVKPLLLAVPGQSIAAQQALVTQQVVPLDRTSFTANVAVVCCGSNDIITGRSATQVSSDLAALCQTLRSAGFKVIVSTITLRSDGSNGAYASVFNAVNQTIRTSYSVYADAIVDWAADGRLSDPTNTLYFADQCHTTDAGDDVKAQLVQTALDPMLQPPAAALSYASFYAGGRSFTGNYGTFVRS